MRPGARYDRQKFIVALSSYANPLRPAIAFSSPGALMIAVAPQMTS